MCVGVGRSVCCWLKYYGAEFFEVGRVCLVLDRSVCFRLDCVLLLAGMCVFSRSVCC